MPHRTQWFNERAVIAKKDPKLISTEYTNQSHQQMALTNLGNKAVNNLAVQHQIYLLVEQSKQVYRFQKHSEKQQQGITFIQTTLEVRHDRKNF